MTYRVEVDVAFNTEDDAIAFLNLLQEIKPKICVTEGTKIPIVARARYHECTHDDAEPKQCGNYINFDLKWEEKEEVKNKAGVKIAADTLITKQGA